jgi:NAD(P)-dependent dehydrogenase (short-subunit alcohol dehydrogenase family)
MASKLSGKRALITGGSRGIGAAIAKAFAKEGAKSIIVSRKQEGLDATAKEINSEFPHAVVAKACHLGHNDQIESLVAWVDAEFDGVDILINNAGTNPYFGPLLDITESLWDKIMDVNLKGAFELSRHIAKRWSKTNLKGSIVNIASVAGIFAAPLQGAYGIAKAGMISMTKTLAVELGPLGIRVNAIAPGLIDTKLSQAIVSNPDLAKVFTDHSALRRHGQPEEVAGLAVYLASEESSFVTGQTFCADGGYSIA